MRKTMWHNYLCMGFGSLVLHGGALANGPAETVEEPAAPPPPALLLPVTVDGVYGFIDTNGTLVVEAGYEATHDIGGDDRYGVRRNNRWGFIAPTGELAVPAVFEQARPFAEGLAAVQTADGWGFVAPDGTVVIDPTFLKLSDFESGMARVAVGGEQDESGATLERWGLVKPDGAYILKPSFAFIEPFAEDLAAVNAGGKWGFGRLFGGVWGFVDREGRAVVEPTYERVELFSEGLAAVRDGGRWGYVDRKGTTVIKPTYAAAGAFADGLAIVRSGETGVGVIDPTGKIVAPLDYDSITAFRDGVAVVRKDLRNGLIDRDGKVILEPVHAGIQLLGESRVGLQKRENGSWQLIDTQGRPASETRFTGIDAFYDSRARVYVGGAYDPIVRRYAGGLWGYCDPAGNVVIEAIYQHAYPFENGVATVRLEDQWQLSLINPAGEILATNVAFGTRRQIAQYTAMGQFITPEIVKIQTGHRPPQTGYYSISARRFIWRLRN